VFDEGLASRVGSRTARTKKTKARAHAGSNIDRNGRLVARSFGQRVSIKNYGMSPVPMSRERIREPGPALVPAKSGLGVRKVVPQALIQVGGRGSACIMTYQGYTNCIHMSLSFFSSKHKQTKRCGATLGGDQRE
jgi:hypothetical protein